MLAGVDAMVQRQTTEAARSVGWWLGAGLALGPAFDVADRHGVLTNLASPSTFELAPMLKPLALIALFVVVAVGAARVLPDHAPRARVIFFAACAIPVAAWVLYTGLRAATLVSLIALVFAFVRLRSLPR